MKPAKITQNVFETDGPPMAYFSVISEEFLDGSPGARLYFKYRALGLGRRAPASKGKPKELIRAGMEIMARILKAVGEAAGDTEVGIIFWRVRPEIRWCKPVSKIMRGGEVLAPGIPGHWMWYCRLATSPPLPDSFWKSVFLKPEGEVVTFMDDVAWLPAKSTPPRRFSTAIAQTAARHLTNGDLPIPVWE